MKVINRIKANEDFALAIKKGQTYQSASFRLHVRNSEYDHTRVGISASKKLGNAVTRNRVKRQTRAIVDSLIDYNKYALDIVIILKLKFLEKDFDDNKSQFCDFMKTQVGL